MTLGTGKDKGNKFIEELGQQIYHDALHQPLLALILTLSMKPHLLFLFLANAYFN